MRAERVRRAILVSGVLILLGGCALGPGHRVSDADLREKSRREDGAAGDVKVIPITAELIMRQHKAVAEAPPLARDPLEEQVKTYEYKIAPYDVLGVTVWDHPELTIPAGEFRAAEAAGHTVTTAGTIFYPHVGVVQVAGKTLAEVRQLLTERLVRYVTKPQLDVKVVSFRGYRVNVTGEVMGQGTFPITDLPMRALDAIGFAKGPNPDADLRRATLTRDGKTHLLDLQAVNELGDVSQNWLLKDGDILHVPDRNANRVYVLGEIKKPSARVMVKGRMTLADALGDSEGFDPLTADPGEIYVFRGAYDRPGIFKLDARSPDAMLLAAQFSLNPRDVVYVSSTSLAQWNRVLQQILPTVQALWYGADVATRSLQLQRVLVPAPTPTTTTN